MVRVPRWLWILRWISGIVVVALIAAVLGAWWTSRRSFPQTEGTVTVAGLNSPVTVIRDDNGIPHVYAETPENLFFAQGYVQAQDRFFEMDYRRHVTSGRLAELFGREALETDMFVRTLGWRRVAERELSLLKTDTRRYLESFASGVNAYLGDHDGAELSLEYAVLGLGGLDYTPEEWTSEDSLAWLKAISWTLGSNMQDEIARSLQAADLTRTQIAALYPDYPYRENRPVVTQGAIVDGVFEQDAKKNDTRFPRRPPFPVGARDALLRAKSASEGISALLGTGDGLGSNAWAVSGRHTASGQPILANDPHLEASMPSAWYQMGLHCVEVDRDCPFDVSGFTFAGLPGVVIGHNADIAWGFSNLYPDVQDLYLEKVLDGDRYLYNGRKPPLQVREETFEIAGEEDPVTIEVRESRHGPLISDVDEELSTVGANAPVPKDAPERDTGYAVALRWTALTPGRTADALFGLNIASGWNEFRDAASSFDSPSQNIVYADVAGHIGYQAPGLIPVRRTGDGSWPVPGWNPAYEWDDNYVPFEALPNVLDPDDGYVVTANQAVTTPRYPYFLGNAFDYGYRSQRILELLQSKEALTPDDMAEIQLDDYSELAERLTPMLRSVRLPSSYYEAGQQVLDRWNFEMDADSKQAAYFNVVWKNLLRLTFHDQLPKETWPEGGSRWWEVMRELVEAPDHVFWDNTATPDVRETRDDIVRQALIDARDELTSLMSRNPQDWRWGMLHTLTLRNPTLGSAGSPAAFVFNRGEYELSGGPSIVNATHWDASSGYQATAVPSMRMIIPLDDLDDARWINLTGASGHPYNDHYTDQTDLWVIGETLPWAFTRDAVEAAGEQTLTLEPADE
ncbi:MAG: penicillin acylase family protein [Nocardioidaceae bacterium]|nr:penicillin acylase family protein [Nocardioidaceae bacterium]